MADLMDVLMKKKKEDENQPRYEGDSFLDKMLKRTQIKGLKRNAQMAKQLNEANQ